MSNLVLLMFCLLAGIGLRKSGRFSDHTPSALNGFVIYISLPALALYHIHHLQFSASLLYAGMMAWVLFGLGALFFALVGKWAGFDRGTIGALMLVGGLGNTSFVGLPMIEAYYGPDLLGVGIVADLVGSFFVLSTLGISVAAAYSHGAAEPRQIARKILSFPPFLALVAALLLKSLPSPGWLDQLLVQLGGTLTPLALVSVGFQLRLGQMRQEIGPLGLGLFYKLILGPALVTLIFVGILGGRGEIMQVTLFEAAMGPMISAGIVAVDYRLNPRLVSLMLGIGIPTSFLTLPLWYRLLQGV